METQELTKLLEVYTLEEILEISELTPEEALLALYEMGLLILPETRPL